MGNRAGDFSVMYKKGDDLNDRAVFVESLGKFRHNLPFSPYQGPHFVAVNNKNEIIVTDFHNHSVKVRRAPRWTPGV